MPKGIKGFQKGNHARKKAPHTIQAEAFKKYLIEQVIKEAKPIVQALIAKGKQGDVQALKEIFDRILGRSKENLDITSLGEQLGVVVLPIKQINENILATTTETSSSSCK